MWVQSLGWEDSLEKENDNPLQYSSLENFTKRGVWWAVVRGITELDTTKNTITQKGIHFSFQILSLTYNLQNCFGFIKVSLLLSKNQDRLYYFNLQVSYNLILFLALDTSLWASLQQRVYHHANTIFHVCFKVQNIFLIRYSAAK